MKAICPTYYLSGQLSHSFNLRRLQNIDAKVIEACTIRSVSQSRVGYALSNNVLNSDVMLQNIPMANVPFQEYGSLLSPTGQSTQTWIVLLISRKLGRRMSTWKQIRLVLPFSSHRLRRAPFLFLCFFSALFDTDADRSRRAEKNKYFAERKS